MCIDLMTEAKANSSRSRRGRKRGRKRPERKDWLKDATDGPPSRIFQTVVTMNDLLLQHLEASHVRHLLISFVKEHVVLL